MLFNSLQFLFFLPSVFLLYWFVADSRIRTRNILIIIASYFFYACWDWRFLFLIFSSSLVDFLVGIYIGKTQRDEHRKGLLCLSLFTNLGLLCFFKYFNFFISEFSIMLSGLGLNTNISTLNIILPVGISFYTFQTLSYTIDIYRRKLTPTKDPFAFFAFVSFFPQLVAGPIERASNLLPQFSSERVFKFDEASNGMRQILWGFFKKIVIADNCAILVDEMFSHSNYSEIAGLMLLLGIILFSFQIYADFSGYSDIAIGVAKLFGINLMRNFAFPYLSRDVAEFWRRWHISLSTWFRDYLYIPLGGSRGSVYQKIRNVFIIFIVSGFWHGANWTFIAWGFLHAIFFIYILISGRHRVNIDTVAEGKILPESKEVIQMVTTFIIICLTWTFFRAESVSSAFDYILNMIMNIFVLPKNIQYATFHQIIKISSMIFILQCFEWINRSKKHGLDITYLRPMRWCTYLFILLLMLLFGQFNQTEFIYFQF